MSKIAVIGLGGTIAMAAGAHGLVPSRSVAELVDTLGEADEVDCEDLAEIASANLSWFHLFELRRRLHDHFAAGGRGAVIVQGTDTLEETAFIVELLGCGRGGPVAFTGAMRGAGADSADGPGNLLAALCVARHAPRDLGVVVVMNDVVHAARRVRKAHTTSVDAFSSGEAGHIGRIQEGRLDLLQALPGPLPIFDPTAAPPPVAVATLGFGCGLESLLSARDPSVRGCILQAFGAGHVPETLTSSIGDLASKMPVVLCSRTGEGRIAERTYGYPGGEMDLLARGVLPGRRFTPAKARVALQLCLASERGEPSRAFAQLAKGFE